jgi:hypothetical protein
VFACPQCERPLYEVEEGGAARFRCDRGHTCAPDALCPGLAADLEGILPDLVGALID